MNVCVYLKQGVEVAERDAKPRPYQPQALCGAEPVGERLPGNDFAQPLFLFAGGLFILVDGLGFICRSGVRE